MISRNEDEFHLFCKHVVDLDPSIRFAGIADEDGKLESIAERRGLVPLLTPEERAQYAITASVAGFSLA